MASRRKVYRDSVRDISNPSLKRLVYKAGIPRVSGKVYEELRGVMKVYTEEVVRLAIKVAEYKKQKTILLKDVENAISQLGSAYIAHGGKKCGAYQSSGGKKEGRKFHPGTVALREIRKIQKSDCSVLSKAPFERFVKEMVQDFSDREPMRVSADAHRAIQAYVEQSMVSTLQDAAIIIVSAKRQTLMPKDIQAARRINKERA